MNATTGAIRPKRLRSGTHRQKFQTDAAIGNLGTQTRLHKILAGTSVAILLTIGFASESPHSNTFAQSAQAAGTPSVEEVSESVFRQRTHCEWQGFMEGAAETSYEAARQILKV